MSRSILGSLIAATALLLLASAYLLADDSAAGAVPLVVLGVGILLSAVKVLGRRRLG